MRSHLLTSCCTKTVKTTFPAQHCHQLWRRHGKHRCVQANCLHQQGTNSTTGKQACLMLAAQRSPSHLQAAGCCSSPLALHHRRMPRPLPPRMPRPPMPLPPIGASGASLRGLRTVSSTDRIRHAASVALCRHVWCSTAQHRPEQSTGSAFDGPVMTRKQQHSFYMTSPRTRNDSGSQRAGTDAGPHAMTRTSAQHTRLSWRACWRCACADPLALWHRNRNSFNAIPLGPHSPCPLACLYGVEFDQCWLPHK